MNQLKAFALVLEACEMFLAGGVRCWFASQSLTVQIDNKSAAVAVQAQLTWYLPVGWAITVM